MKKISAFFCVAISTSVCAQEKDLFNIDQHLQKKQAEQVKIFKLSQLPASPLSISFSSVIPVQTTSILLANGDTLYYGNGTMPCVKPDMKEFGQQPNNNISPNVFFNGPMPNAAIRPKFSFD